MKTYLRIVNPVVAALVLLLCLWAAMFDEGHFKPFAFVQGGIPTYFIAKGLFCSSALVLIGRILSLMAPREK